MECNRPVESAHAIALAQIFKKEKSLKVVSDTVDAGGIQLTAFRCGREKPGRVGHLLIAFFVLFCFV